MKMYLVICDNGHECVGFDNINDAKFASGVRRRSGCESALADEWRNIFDEEKNQKIIEVTV